MHFTTFSFYLGEKWPGHVLRFTLIWFISTHFTSRLKTYSTVQTKSGKDTDTLFSPLNISWNFLSEAGEVNSKHPSVHCLRGCCMKSVSLWGVDAPFKSKRKRGKEAKRGQRAKLGTPEYPPPSAPLLRDNSCIFWAQKERHSVNGTGWEKLPHMRKCQQ